MTLSKKRREQVARASRQHGYYVRGTQGFEVKCPLCGLRVECDKNYRETPARAIDRVMRDEHLLECPELTLEDAQSSAGSSSTTSRITHE